MSVNNNYTYAAARTAFLERIDGARHIEHIHPEQGPDGEIAMDIAMWDPDPRAPVLVISSGTHGIEGYCGSFVQCALLQDGLAKRSASGFALVMVHAVNPHGFAWQRRVNEENVDLNRNFVDHEVAYPINTGYREIASILEPETWTENTGAEIAGALRAAARHHADDPRWVQAALTAGQYEFPNGQFYGGQRPQWSNRTLRAFAREHLAGRQVTWIDVHTALGEYATAQCIVEIPPESAKIKRAEALWGERVGNVSTQGSVSVDVSGSVITALQQEIGDDVLATGLEYGTLSQTEVAGALIEDQWLHRYGVPGSAAARRTKARMMNAFYPDDDRWRAAVLEIAHEVVMSALQEGLSGMK